MSHGIRVGLLPVTTGGHRIGLLLDCGMGEDLIQRHIQVCVYVCLYLSRSLSL